MGPIASPLAHAKGRVDKPASCSSPGLADDTGGPRPPAPATCPKEREREVQSKAARRPGGTPGAPMTLGRGSKTADLEAVGEARSGAAPFLIQKGRAGLRIPSRYFKVTFRQPCRVDAHHLPGTRLLVVLRFLAQDRLALLVDLCRANGSIETFV
jgi:hypothetical protein